MKKAIILLFSLTAYAAGVVNFGIQPQSTVFAAELNHIQQQNTSYSVDVEKKSIHIKDKATSHERFDQEKEKQTEPVQATPEKEVTQTVNVEATAYTAFCEGCSGKTSTGIDLRANPDRKVIAVDPNVIPLGSKVRVPGYGVAIAGDIGGDIEGHRIDVFIPKQGNAMDFGRRQIQVEILES